MKIPYGISDFGTIRDKGFFYADKTSFLPVLEDGYQHVVFLRPRRFGKSTLLSMLEHYYDLGKRDRFDALFGGLWVHAHPTAEQGAHLVLSLDFSPVATDRGQDALRRTFDEAVRGYASDKALLSLLLGDRALQAGMLVFVGAKKVLFRPWDGDGEAKRAPAKRGKKVGRRARG